jgi:type I restriction enzyme, S subunit
MNAAQVIDHFDRISDAPDAIPRLRQFILELAVRGKLVDQDPRDEHASELLKRIQAEKERRILEGQMKEPEALSEVRSDEPWFEIPASWHWVRLGAIAQVLMGQSPKGESYNKTGEGIPLINGPVEFTEGPFSKTVINQYTTAPTNICEEGDLLLCVRGSTTGRTNVAGFRACIGRGVAAIRPLLTDQYVRLFIWRLRAAIIAMGRGIAFPSVSRQQIEKLPIPLPPLAEQERIVAKVDELMALCDRLEAAQADRESRRDKLAAASLHRLNNGAASDEFRERAQFHLRHLPRLTTRPEHIQQLRQTILNLAVRGKLVPQDPNDEPVSDLIERIRAEKAQMVRDSKLKTVKPIPPMGSDLPYQCSIGWSLAQLQSLCMSITDGDHLPPPKTSQGIPFLVIGNVRNKSIEFAGCRHVSEEYFNALDSIRRPNRGDILYTLVGSFGIPIRLVDDRPFCVQRHISILRPSKLLDAIYLSLALESQFVFDQAAACATGIAQKTVPLSGLRKMRVPLPPLVEQHRIVAKVGELMTVCDRLEAQLTTTQTESRHLLEAVLYESLSANGELI